MTTSSAVSLTSSPSSYLPIASRAATDAAGLGTAIAPTTSPTPSTTLQISGQAVSLYKASLAPVTTPTYTVAKALTLGASASPGSLAISDTATNISRNFDKLIAITGKISTLQQTDATAIGLTEAQFNAGVSPSPAEALLYKINSGQFKVALSGVHIANLSGIASYGSKVAAFAIADTSANIASKLDAIAAFGLKVSAITQTTKSALDLSYANTIQYASVLSKIDKGSYTLKLTDTASNIKTNLAALAKLGTKLASITQTDASQAITLNTADLTANLSTLVKINAGAYKVSLEDTAAAITKSWSTLSTLNNNIGSLKLTDATPALTLSAAQAVSGADLINKVSNATFGLTVSDNASNLSNSLSKLLALSSKITQIKQTAVGNLAVTQSQLADPAFTALLAKLSPTSYSLAVSGANKTNIASIVANTHVKSVSLSVTDGTLTSSDATINAALASSKITSIDINKVSIANLGSLSADKRITSIGITDSAANLSNTVNLASLDALMKKTKGIVTGINLDAGQHQVLTVDQASYTKYAATVFSAPKNFALEVDLGTPTSPIGLSTTQLRNALKTTANSNGTFSAQVWDFSKGIYNKAITLNAGVNFVKLGGTSTFLDSGDAKLNAVLNVGSYQWQQNPQQATATTSDFALKPGVFALGSGSANPTVTYKFLTSSTDGNLTVADKKGFAVMSSDQKAAVTNVLNYISSLVNIKFQLVTTGTADINFGTNNQGTTSGGYATGANPALSSVNLLLNNQSSVNAKPQPGDYGWETIVHEIGHTLGLKHPGNYNAGGGGTTGPYLSVTDDNRRNTIMSYNNATDAATNWVSTGSNGFIGQGVNPTTFMPIDILALDFLYGKNQTGTSLSDPSKSLADFQTTQFTSSWIGMETLSSPTNGLSLNLSSLSAPNIVDLRAGAFSSINIKDANYNAGIGGAKAQTFFNLNNVGLAYDASISRLIGGSLSDVVYVSNKNVEIDGNGGNDTVYLYGSASDWTSSQAGGETTYTNGSVTAKLKNIESIKYYALTSNPILHSRLDLTA